MGDTLVQDALQIIQVLQRTVEVQKKNIGLMKELLEKKEIVIQKQDEQIKLLKDLVSQYEKLAEKVA